MANKRYDQFTTGTPATTDITLYANPSTGALNKCTLPQVLALGLNPSTLLNIVQTLGSPIKSFNANVQKMGLYQRALLFQNAGYFFLNYLTAGTITGAWYGFDIANNITATNFNGFALYSVSGSTLTRIAITANDPTLFTGTINVFRQAAFTAPVTVTAGVYYLAMLSCSSAQVSRCMIYANDWYANTFLTTLGMSNANRTHFFISSLTTLGTSVSTASITGSDAVIPFMGLY